MLEFYDETEPTNKLVYERLPLFYQNMIKQWINLLKKCVNSIFFGCEIRFTSGFRSPQVNTKCGGVVDSLHLYGLAVDFVALENDQMISASRMKAILNKHKDIDFLTFIHEKNHIHCSFTRNNQDLQIYFKGM